MQAKRLHDCWIHHFPEVLKPQGALCRGIEPSGHNSVCVSNNAMALSYIAVHVTLSKSVRHASTYQAAPIKQNITQTWPCCMLKVGCYNIISYHIKATSNGLLIHGMPYHRLCLLAGVRAGPDAHHPIRDAGYRC
jgi:hypothetical protein